MADLAKAIKEVFSTTLPNNFIEAISELLGAQKLSIPRVWLESVLVSDKDMLAALLRGHVISDQDGNIAFLQHSGDLYIDGDDSDDREWRTISEYDWYKIGEELASGDNLELLCMCQSDDGWVQDEIVAFAPKSSNNFIGKNGRYSDAIVLDWSGERDLPVVGIAVEPHKQQKGQERNTRNNIKPVARLCKCGCGKSISHKHPNARFFSQKHKDRYWNEVNPRGMYAHLRAMTGLERPSRDQDIEDEFHPMDSYSLGQE